jgi:hypothetical protein
MQIWRVFGKDDDYSPPRPVEQFAAMARAQAAALAQAHWKL